MKKLVLLSVFAVALCASADSYLYWMVSDKASGTVEGGDPISAGIYSAKVVAIDTTKVTTGWEYGAGTYLNIYPSVNGGLGAGPLTTDPSIQIGTVNGNTPDNLTYFVNLAEYAGANWTYFVELYNDCNIFAHSEALPYAEASIAGLSGMATPGKIWMPAAFVPAAVPEPNSALLMLIGCAALALRRRKQIAA